VSSGPLASPVILEGNIRPVRAAKKEAALAIACVENGRLHPMTETIIGLLLVLAGALFVCWVNERWGEK